MSKDEAPNGQMDAIIIALGNLDQRIASLDQKIERYSIHLRDQFVRLRERFADHRDYVDGRVTNIEALIQDLDVPRKRVGGFSPEDKR